MFQMKEQNKTPETNFNEMEINNLPYKEFKVIVIKMLTYLGKEWVNTERISTKR